MGEGSPLRAACSSRLRTARQRQRQAWRWRRARASLLPPPPPRAGLLLNNLSVFRGCDIVFDSMDVPEKVLDGAQQLDPRATVSARSLVRAGAVRVR